MSQACQENLSGTVEFQGVGDNLPGTDARLLQHECALGEHASNTDNGDLPVFVCHFWNLRNDEIA
jgi:hypothetical protein